jgi:hypothetical protein
MNESVKQTFETLRTIKAPREISELPRGHNPAKIVRVVIVKPAKSEVQTRSPIKQKGRTIADPAFLMLMRIFPTSAAARDDEVYGDASSHGVCGDASCVFCDVCDASCGGAIAQSAWDLLVPSSSWKSTW